MKGAQKPKHIEKRKH